MSDVTCDANRWSSPVYGAIEGHEVTASFGIGKDNKGEILLADGDQTSNESFFIDHSAHDHYGS